MNYPTTDDLLGSLGLTRARPSSSVPDWVTPVTVFTAGLVVGAAGALLLAPKPGREIREDLRIAASHAATNVAHAASNVGANVAHAASNVGETVRNVGETVREKLPALSTSGSNHAARQDAIEAK